MCVLRGIDGGGEIFTIQRPNDRQHTTNEWRHLTDDADTLHCGVARLRKGGCGCKVFETLYLEGGGLATS